MVLVNDDAQGKTAIPVDDMVDTCGTLFKVTRAVRMADASEVVSVVTHGDCQGKLLTTSTRVS
jgi:phosphoribosylpyrophosphate synthetase